MTFSPTVETVTFAGGGLTAYQSAYFAIPFGAHLVPGWTVNLTPSYGAPGVAEFNGLGGGAGGAGGGLGDGLDGGLDGLEVCPCGDPVSSLTVGGREHPQQQDGPCPSPVARQADPGIDRGWRAMTQHGGTHLQIYADDDRPFSVILEPTGITYELAPGRRVDLIIGPGSAHVFRSGTGLVIDTLDTVLVKEPDGRWLNILSGAYVVGPGDERRG